jgi:type III restriction enzyme
MGIPTDLPTSPFEIMLPSKRWTPDLSTSSEKELLGLLPPFVQKIREGVFEWRQCGYDGVSETTKSLLYYWFNCEHKDNFQYYFAQRESVESLIYIFENQKIRDNKELLKFDSWGSLTESLFDDKWLRLLLKQGTGTGKTKVLSLLIAWSYFNKLYENNAELSNNFLIITPNTIVLDRLKRDIDGLRIFNSDPIIPENGFDGRDWQSDFNLTVHIQDEIKSISQNGNIFLTNIQRFAKRTNKQKSDLEDDILGLKPNLTQSENRLKVKDAIKNLDDLVVLNDEAHHIHEDNAWKKTIQDINNNLIQKGNKLPLQIDVTATPKHKGGEIFIQTISDYPIVEAIHQEVVKKPVIPDKNSRNKLQERTSSIFSEKYRDYIDLGVQVWLKQYDKHQKIGKKPLLFIMVDDTKNCDDVAQYLEQTYQILKNGVFVIHTKDNNGTGELSENTSKGKEELRKLRRLVDTVDDYKSPIKVIVSVLMLKEGWDVNNVTTIVGLRAYASHILPEQTLGRGLRRMYFGTDIKEELDVIGTDPFIEFVKQITKEGVELEEVPMGPNNPPSGPLVIEIDKENPLKDIDYLNIDIPIVGSRYARDYLSLDLLDTNQFVFNKQKLKTYTTHEKTKNIVFRDVIHGEKVYEIRFDTTLSIDSSSIIGFFTETISKELRLNGVNHFVYEKTKDFIKNKLFGKTIDLEDIDIIRNLTEPNITQLVINLFKKEINKLTIKDMGFQKSIDNIKISESKSYLTSRKKSHFKPTKSVFNLIIGDSKFELEFAKFLESCDDLISYFKNDIQLGQSIEYVKHDGSVGSYFPDFFIKLNNNERWIVETKGAESLNDPIKFKRLQIWCEDASKSQEINWNCLYVRQEIWNTLHTPPNNFADLINLFNDGT